MVSPGTALLAGARVGDVDRSNFGKALATGLTGDELWKAAARENVSATAINALRLQGRLAFLTADSAPLTDVLAKELDGAPDIGALADKLVLSGRRTGRRSSRKWPAIAGSQSTR